MYKSILVHIDGSARSAQRVDAAARLATAYEGHLIGAALTGLSEFMRFATMVDGAPTIVFPIEALCADAELDLDSFETRARQAGLPSFERRRIDAEAGLAFVLQARYCDLVVLSQAPGGELLPRLPADFLPYVVMNAARPVLVLPAAWRPEEIGRRITVAWNGSGEALRAITSAIPLMKRAERVDLLVLTSGGADEGHGEQPGADMSLYLARHGIAVELSVRLSCSNAGETLLSFAEDRSSDLIVMGAYGHSRLREFVLGGATATALHTSPLPLWMAH